MINPITKSGYLLSVQQTKTPAMITAKLIVDIVNLQIKLAAKKRPNR
ncbi:MAG: hypothetical protein ACI91R_002421 [Vicingaceae bacterium]|jgi:hypothetical protein